MANKIHILIIGGDGDLAVRKLYPALFSLESAGELGEVEGITGMSRSAKDRSAILDVVSKRLADSFQTPAEGSFQTPAEGSYQTPAEGSYQTPAEGSYQTPAEGSYQTPAEGSFQTPAEGSFQTPAEGSFQNPAEGSFQNPAEGSFQNPAEGSYQTPAEGSYQFDDIHWDSFTDRLNFVAGDATSVADLKTFAESIDLETTQLIVYFAIPPKVFEGVCRAMNAAGLVVPATRVVVEKPLGASCDSFAEIHEHMARIFNEYQVYRIDHYLGKESVQNLLALRFANVIFSSIWNSDHIDSVQITVAETVGVENRHEFYDEVGALRDMVQNHLLQILCLIALEPPANKDADMIRQEKLKVIQSLKPIVLEDINSKTVRGQYSSGIANGQLARGYRDEIGRDCQSNTETYVAIKAEIDNWRWAGVPFYLRTGKRLSSRCAEIVVQFKKPRHSIFADQSLTLPGNSLHIRLQPDDGVQLRFLNKQPGIGELPLEELDMNLQEPDVNRKYSFDAYARLLLEVLRGDQTLFVSNEEVVASWKWIDEIRANWDLANSKEYPYAAGTSGPSQAEVLIARDNREWKEIAGLI